MAVDGVDLGGGDLGLAQLEPVKVLFQEQPFRKIFDILNMPDKHRVPLSWPPFL